MAVGKVNLLNSKEKITLHEQEKHVAINALINLAQEISPCNNNEQIFNDKP